MIEIKLVTNESAFGYPLAHAYKPQPAILEVYKRHGFAWPNGLQWDGNNEKRCAVTMYVTPGMRKAAIDSIDVESVIAGI